MKTNAPHFNIFTWPAPILSIEEFLKEIQKQQLCGKKIKNLRVLGAYGGINRWNAKDIIARKLFKAGVPYDHEILSNKHFDNFLVEPFFSANEPLVIDFEDGSSFEFLPLRNQRVRMGRNFIAPNIKDGVDPNRESPSQRLDIPFSDFRLKKIEIMTKDKQENYHRLNDKNKYFLSKNYLASDTTIVTYEFILYKSSQELIFVIEKDPFYKWYNISLDSYFLHEPFECTYSELMKRLPQQFDISLFSGADGSFEICPIKQANQQDEITDNFSYECQIDIEEDLFGLLLYDSFKKHFQLSEQDDEEERYEDSFDWYGSNCYSISSMKLVLSDIKQKIKNIQEHSSKLDFDRIRNYFESYEFYLKENPDVNKDIDIDYEELLIDFYTRFCRYCEEAMNTPGFDKFYVKGP